MAEATSTKEEQEPTPDELKVFVKANSILQQSWLMLIQQCHQPDYQVTLQCCLQAQENALKKQNASTEFVTAISAPLIMVLSACYNISKETTLANMRNAFLAFNQPLPVERQDKPDA